MTKKKYAYLLCISDEYGPDDIMVTLKRDAVSDLLDAYLVDDALVEGRRKLAEILKRPDEQLESGESLESGWGGVKFYAVEIQS